ncbi:MAG: hypothetical protein IJW54_07440 [Clostridia bacterium]|nr:hypothetical protein [Clostridia bacterium]
MKKLIALIIALALSLSCIIALSSCSLDNLDEQIEDMSTMVKNEIDNAIGGYLKEDPMFKE